MAQTPLGVRRLLAVDDVHDPADGERHRHSDAAGDDQQQHRTCGAPTTPSAGGADRRRAGFPAVDLYTPALFSVLNVQLRHRIQ